jgi:hypothetical protein
MKEQGGFIGKDLRPVRKLCLEVASVARQNAIACIGRRIVVRAQRIVRVGGGVRVTSLSLCEGPTAPGLARQLRQRDAQDLAEKRIGADHRTQAWYREEPRLHALELYVDSHDGHLLRTIPSALNGRS